MGCCSGVQPEAFLFSLLVVSSSWPLWFGCLSGFCAFSVHQRQERFAERPALLELERFERRDLERKAAELEEELKALSDLRADNQRLKDENAALIRVISKLSK